MNDHEADWEQVTIFLVDHGADREPEPAWVAFSSHDEVGDDLRRRWDDPDISFVDGTHPVVYAGAGSHSGAYLPGEYVTSVGLPLPGFLSGYDETLLDSYPGATVVMRSLEFPTSTIDAVTAIQWGPVRIVIGRQPSLQIRLPGSGTIAGCGA